MSYQKRLDEARALLVQHNSQVPNSINIDKFFDNLTKAGGTTEAALTQCTWDDLQEFGAPKLVAKQVAFVFRLKDKDEGKPVFKKSKIEAMSVAELVQHYDPRDKSGLVFTRLAHLLSGKKFVVFNEDGTVNVQHTTKLAQEILDDYPERDQIFVNEQSCNTYKVGERPDQAFDENPLYSGRVLRSDGDCDQTNRSWSGVNMEVKQVIYLASKTGEIKINSLNDAHNIMDLVVGKTDVEALKIVRQRFGKAAAQLKEMYQQGRAPTLKIFRKTEKNKVQDPFGTNKTY